MADTTDLELLTVAKGAELIHRTEDWYTKQLRARKLPGRKVGRFWMLTRSDIEAAIDSMARPAIAPKPDPAGLTVGSRRRLNRRMAG